MNILRTPTPAGITPAEMGEPEGHYTRTGWMRHSVKEGLLGWRLRIGRSGLSGFAKRLLGGFTHLQLGLHQSGTCLLQHRTLTFEVRSCRIELRRLLFQLLQLCSCLQDHWMFRSVYSEESPKPFLELLPKELRRLGCSRRL